MTKTRDQETRASEKKARGIEKTKMIAAHKKADTEALKSGKPVFLTKKFIM